MTAELCDLELWLHHHLSTCANKMCVRFTILLHPKTMTSTTFNTFQECECLLGSPPCLGHNMTALNFKSFSTIRNTWVCDVISSCPNSEQDAQVDCFLSVSVTQSQSLSAWLKAHSFFYQCAKVDSGCARVGKVWSWHDAM